MPLISSSDLAKKIRAEDFDRLYYFYGHDVGALETYVKKLIKKLCPPEDRIMNLHQFDGKSPDIAAISDACEALPMFAQRVVVTINDLNIDSVSKADGDDLRRILSDLPETTVVVIYATGVDLYKNKRNLTDKNKRFSDFCAKQGSVCEFAYKRPSDMGKTIVAAVKKAGCDISKADSEYLAACCLCDTSFVNQEIEKLTAYASNRMITRDDIDSLCIKRVESDGFALAINILRANAPMVFNRIKELSDQNYEAFEILGVISFSMADLYRAKLARASGRSVSECAADFKYGRNREFAVKNAYSECSNMTCERIRQSLKIFSDADLLLKTRSQGKSGDLLTLEQAAAKAMALRC